jgi:hypothetical protein
MSESKTRIDPQLYDEFLLELRALDEFRAQLLGAESRAGGATG